MRVFILDTMEKILRDLGISRKAWPLQWASSKFQCVFLARMYGPACFELYEFRVNNTSDFYLVKLWCGTINMTQYAMSEKFNLGKDCPKCEVLGS